MNSMGQQESLTQCPPPDPWGQLDKSVSPRVGDFAQKNYPPPNYPGGGTLGVTLNITVKAESPH